jgi:hypothetical protein
MDLVNEEDTGHNFGTALFAPFSYLLVYLFSNLWLDFTNITGKQCEETLSSAVNNVDFMKSHCMDNLLSLLELTLRALHKACLWSNVVVVAASSEGASELGDLTRGLIDGNDVTSDNLLLLNGFYHLLSKVVNGLHLSGLKGDLASLATAGNRFVDFNFYDLTFNNFSFLSNTDSDGLSECLSECLSL